MDWNCRGWEAWHDHMPGSPPTLHVSGECEMPSPGYTLTLTPAEPQGINPDDLILVLTATEPTDVQTQVLTWTPSSTNRRRTTSTPRYRFVTSRREFRSRKLRRSTLSISDQAA